MQREITLKFTQTIPEHHIKNRKPLEQAANVLISTIRKEFRFDGDIAVVETKEIE